MRAGSRLAAMLPAVFACLVLQAGAAQAVPPPAIADDPSAIESGAWAVEQEGIVVELAIDPIDPAAPQGLREGEGVRFRFSVSDTTTGQPLSGLYPAAWMSLLREGETSAADRCEQKVEELVGGSILNQAELDLNVYYVLAMNQDATITVVDPLFGFGGTKLLALLNLPSPGEDWVLSSDRSRLFVSAPETNRIVVADTAAWQVAHHFDAGPRPTRLELQPDGAFLWVSTLSGIAVVDLGNLRVAARIKTGERPHDIAFSDDSRYAFVTSQGAGNLSVIDIRTLRKVVELETGAQPVSVAYSPLAQSAYVTHEGDGMIVVVDGRKHEVVARMELEPGLGQIRFAPGGRLGFAVNPRRNTLEIIDAALNRIVQTGDMKAGPDQIAFTDDLAYIRHRGSEQVLMVPLDEVGEIGRAVPVIDFPGGQAPYGQSGRASPAASIVRAPGATAVLVANPADQMIYYYKEGMAAPMGGFQNYDRQPRAVLVVDRSLRERAEAGTYETAAMLRSPGRYEVTFYLDTPRIVHCFEAEVLVDPELEKLREASEPVHVEPLFKASTVTVGETVHLRYKLTDPHTREPEHGLSDVQVLAHSPGNWHRRLSAQESGDGVYEVAFQPPAPGLYRLQLECLSQRLEFHRSPEVFLRVVPPSAAGAGSIAHDED